MLPAATALAITGNDLAGRLTPSRQAGGFDAYDNAESAMPGTIVPTCTDYALRLTERFDGRATYIDGAYIAAARPRCGEGVFQVTRDARSAMRFVHTDAASRFCAESRAGARAMDDRLRRLIRTYAIDIVAIRRPR